MIPVTASPTPTRTQPHIHTHTVARTQSATNRKRFYTVWLNPFEDLFFGCSMRTKQPNGVYLSITFFHLGRTAASSVGPASGRDAKRKCCRDLILSFQRHKRNICLWQIKFPVVEKDDIFLATQIAQTHALSHTIRAHITDRKINISEDTVTLLEWKMLSVLFVSALALSSVSQPTPATRGLPLTHLRHILK